MLYTKANIVNKEGKISGVASTSVIDRQGESVSVDGWDLKNFKKAPRLLWSHDHYEPAIGKVTKINVTGEGKKRALTFEAVFQDVTEKARAIKKLVEDGFLNTFSVGFKPLEMDGSVISKQELLEISVVNVPANPEAMMLAYKSLEKDGIDKKFADEILIKEEPEEPDEIEQIKEELKAVKETAELAVKGLRHLNPQTKVEKRNVLTDRQTLAKVIAKTADKLIQEPSSAKSKMYAKVIKQTSEILIRSHKEELSGKT